MADHLTLPRPLIQGPSAWIGADIAQRPQEWTYQLSAPELAEIAAATRANHGRDIASITRDDFPLPKFGPVLERMRDELLHGRGFVLLRGLPVEGRPIEESATAYWGIGTYIGSARSQNAKGHVLGHVRDLGLATDDPNVRTYQTTERQHFHTDSCDVVALLCLKTAKSGGLSSLVSSNTIYNVMAERHPDLVWRLFQPFATDRRGEVPEGKKPWFDMPVFNDFQGYLSAIYSGTYIRSAARFAEARQPTEEDFAALECFDDLANDQHLRTSILCTTIHCCTTARVSSTGPSRNASVICFGCGWQCPVRGHCLRSMRNVTAASRSATAAGSSARAPGCMRHWSRSE
jgi:hypothetical protein